MPSKGVYKLMTTSCLNLVPNISGINDFCGVILTLGNLMKNRAETPFFIFPANKTFVFHLNKP